MNWVSSFYKKPPKPLLNIMLHMENNPEKEHKAAARIRWMQSQLTVIFQHNITLEHIGTVQLLNYLL